MKLELVASGLVFVLVTPYLWHALRLSGWAHWRTAAYLSSSALLWWCLAGTPALLRLTEGSWGVVGAALADVLVGFGFVVAAPIRLWRSREDAEPGGFGVHCSRCWGVTFEELHPHLLAADDVDGGRRVPGVWESDIGRHLPEPALQARGEPVMDCCGYLAAGADRHQVDVLAEPQFGEQGSAERCATQEDHVRCGLSYRPEHPRDREVTTHLRLSNPEHRPYRAASATGPVGYDGRPPKIQRSNADSIV